VIAGDADLASQISDFRAELLAKPRDRKTVIKDVADMRARLAAAKPRGAALDIKTGPGRLQDIELFAQTGALLRGDGARSLGDQVQAAIEVFELSPQEGTLLQHAADLFWCVQSAARLISKDPLTTEATGASAEAFLLRDLDVKSVADLSIEIAKTAQQVADLIDKTIGAATSVR
jgi:glutamate-ammonia-ligase adenylyltransferase